MNDSPSLPLTGEPPIAVPVMVPLPTPGPYSYLTPPGAGVRPGAVVEAPVGRRLLVGIVWDGNGDDVDPAKLRPIAHVFDCPPVNRETRRFLDWVAAYTLSSPGLVARMALGSRAALEPEARRYGLRPGGRTPERLTPARARVIALAEKATGAGPAWMRTELARAAGVAVSVVDGLVAQGVLERFEVRTEPVAGRPDPDFAAPVLTSGQQAAADCLNALARDTPSVTLIDGVTGSGKTEVCFEAVADTLRRGRQALILLPEIALTAAWLDRFAARFGSRPAQWHSDMGPRLREKTWRQIAGGVIRAVVGARSALFLPFTDLGLVVVDEEHDAAYKQEERIFYHARDMAVARARLGGFPAVLMSATPSVESRVNAVSGKYRCIRLCERFGNASLPSLHLIDMRRDPPARGGFLSPALIEAIGETIGRGEQALLFLNRRGYAPLTLCRVCGHRFECPHCSAWLVEHRFRPRLQCHYCGFAMRAGAACPQCGEADHLVACGPGIERVGEEMDRHFPEARTIPLSSDLAGGVRRLRRELDVIARGETDIVVGTQIVAKGHNFPLLTLVGVVDADIGLGRGDPRASERTFQLLCQVTGRAGRSGRASRGLVQTWQPDHPGIRAIVSGDSEAFYEREIAERRRAGLPPFARLAALIVSATTRAEAEAHARALCRAAPRADAIRVLGPAEAPQALIRGRYRFRLLVHAARGADIQGFVARMTERGDRPRGSVRVQVDIDPQGFM